MASAASDNCQLQMCRWLEDGEARWEFTVILDRSLTGNYYFVFQLPWSSQFIRAAPLDQTSIVSSIIKEPQQVQRFLSVVTWSVILTLRNSSSCLIFYFIKTHKKYLYIKKALKKETRLCKNSVSLSGHHDSLIFISMFWRRFFPTSWRQTGSNKPTQSSKPPPDSAGMQRKTFTWLKRRHTPALKVCAWQPLRE